MIDAKRLARSFFKAVFRSQGNAKDSRPRNYAALAGDGLMPEVMPPLASVAELDPTPTGKPTITRQLFDSDPG